MATNIEVSLLIAQIFGLILTLKGLPSDAQIKALSGTYFNFNPHILKHLVATSYDRTLGIFIITLPTLTTILNFNSWWINYSIIALGIIAMFPLVKNFFVMKRFEKIKKTTLNPVKD